MVEIVSDFNLKNTFNEYKDVFLNNKKYWLTYLVFITIAVLSFIAKDNIDHPKFELAIFIMAAVLGVFCILYYFRHSEYEELYKVAFVVILSFGIICAFVVPIVCHVDEIEHLTRAELTSHGELIPHWIGDEKGIHRLYNHTDEGEISHAYNRGVGFKTIGALIFFENAHEATVFETNKDANKINTTPYIRGSAYEQNPFYGYLPQAIGILVAKLLDLTNMWMLWLGRIFNLLFFAFIIALAVKITPCLKMPLLAVSCIPVTLYHAASLSIDASIFGLGILAVAYFLYLHQSGENSIDNKHLIMFTGLCLLLGLCKLTFLAFILLLLLIPRENFKNSNALPYIILSILALAVAGFLWSRYSTPAMMHSWRSYLNYANSTQQIQFYLTHPHNLFAFLQYTIGSGLSDMLPELINFDYGNNQSTAKYAFIIMAVEFFLTVVLFTYPYNVKFDLKTKVGAALIFLLVYFSTFFINLMIWANVGGMNTDVHVRYFIPLFALIPIIFQLNNSEDKIKAYDRYTFIFILGFMATLIVAIAARYY